MEKRIKEYIDNHKEEILNDLLSLVKTEGATSEVDNLKDVQNQLKNIIKNRFYEPEEIKVESTRNCYYTKLVDNHVELTIRYLMHPKKSRYVESVIWNKIYTSYKNGKIDLFIGN